MIELETQDIYNTLQGIVRHSEASTKRLNFTLTFGQLFYRLRFNEGHILRIRIRESLYYSELREQCLPDRKRYSQGR
jgi:hypothetical protein